MKIGDAFPSNYLKHDDLQGREVKVVIKSITIEDLGSDRKPVAYFNGTEKGLVLNKTNSYEISYAYGDETDAWIGRPIVLYPARTQYQGKMVPCLRVRVPNEGAPSEGIPATAPAAPAPAEKTMAEELEDDIPF